MNEDKKDIERGNTLFPSRIPVVIWVSLVYVSTIIMQFIHEPLILASVVFTGLFTVHVLLHWYSYKVSHKRFWIYFSIQGCLIYLCAILMPSGYQAVLIGLLPVLIAESLGFSFRLRRAAFIALIAVIIFFDSALTVGDTGELMLFLPIFALMLIIIIAYANLFFRQVNERLRIQNFLQDLQEAHQKVEELTLANERQRMARDLHDTLAQGLAGLIMQLEAANAHMSEGRVERSQEIINLSMQGARRTLAEARRAIDNLRLKSESEVDFKEAILHEVERFQEATGIVAATNLQLQRRLSRVTMEHLLHIIKESLTNIARHAKAEKVWISMSTDRDQLSIEIMDDGAGFNVDLIGKDAGHYGLLGIQERARLIGGELNVSSNSGGTSVTLRLPLPAGNG
ncbi:sensor histidine kinase [Paenibacillus sp. NFR01]|uniref:sensor histidine kinase n=1 Tax=Paenibacillus sp. NFR01 TaxID=1566279 RepID=UPI0008D6399B|nr:sensor histidine kinase [Paenibacillus sp. NFR01]SET04238.1 two-component system, NarL family, sensor histidine kinase YdfH [Paenibacillus sp. NFR01]